MMGRLVRGPGPVGVVALALLCLGLPIPAGAWFATTQDDPGRPAELAPWRVDFLKPDPKREKVNQPPTYLFRSALNGTNDERTPDVGVLELPAIPLGAAIDERLLALPQVGSEGLKVAFEASKSRLQRQGDPKGVILLLEREGAPRGEVPWVRVTIPEKIGRDRRGDVHLAITSWKDFMGKVQAGVFEGELHLTIQHEELHGGEPQGIVAKMVLVVSGTRLVSAEMTGRDSDKNEYKALRVGMRPRVAVKLESVEAFKSEKSAGDELDPGWLLELDDPKTKTIFARLPLPLPDPDANDPLLFRVNKVDGGANWDLKNLAWDLIGVPDGRFRRDDAWRDQLVLQQVRRSKNKTELDHVKLREYIMVTDFPPCHIPGTLRGKVAWISGNESGNEFTNQSPSLSIAVHSGLLITTDMPIEGDEGPRRLLNVMPLVNEEVTVSALIATGPGGPAAASLPRELAVEVESFDPASKSWTYQDVLNIERDEDGPADPAIVRYEGPGQLPFPAAGKYRLKLDPKSEQALAPVRTDWNARGLPPAELVVRVAVEGATGAPPFDSDYPLKVFVDNQPPWWVFRKEPGVDRVYGNEFQNKREDKVTQTRNAMSFLLKTGDGLREMSLRFQGIFQKPAHNEGPHASVPYKGTSSQAVLSVHRRGDADQEAKNGLNIGDGERFGDPKCVYDLRTSIDERVVSQLEERASPQRRLVRFALVGVDAEGEPLGRVFNRSFHVRVSSLWEEFNEEIGLLWPSLILGGVVFGSYWRIRAVRAARERERKRQERLLREKQEEEAGVYGEFRLGDASSRPPARKDYLSNLEPTDDEPPIEQPTKETGPAKPDPGPTYLGGDDPGGRPGGSRFLDGIE